MLVDLNGSTYVLPGDIILPALGSYSMVDFCQGFSHLKFIVIVRGSEILIKVSDERYARFVRRGVLELGGILVVYGIEPQRHRVHGGRTNGDDYYQLDTAMNLFCTALLRMN